MKKILFIGGTQFFGKKAVAKLIANGHKVVIATRGDSIQPFGKQVHHITLDAQDANHPGWAEVTSQKWDAVYDSVIFTKEDAQVVIDKFDGITNYFHYTSSMAVYYPSDNGFREEDFNPLTYEIDPHQAVNYGEGKRQAEMVLFKQAPFNVTAFRFPIVLDTDDYTRRLHFYVEKVLNGETFYFSDPNNKVSYVKGSTAADAIVWAIENQKEGIYNVSVQDAIPISTFIKWLEEEIGKHAKVTYDKNISNESPFNFKQDSFVISDKIINEGFELGTLEEWLRPLIRDIASELSSN